VLCGNDGGDEKDVGQALEIIGVLKVLHTFVLQTFFLHRYSNTLRHPCPRVSGVTSSGTRAPGLNFFQIFAGEQEDSLFVKDLQKTQRLAIYLGWGEQA
jgi:hypothetical protein